jgi:hypothetical protein
MKRKSYIAGILAAAVMLTAAATTPRYCRLISSAQNFRHYFQAMQSSVGSLGPVERFAYSLMLASSQPAQSKK